MEIDVLKVLDDMDEIRRTHYHDKKPNADLLCRMLEAVLARAGGYENRAAWTAELKQRPSAYARDIDHIENITTF